MPAQPGDILAQGASRGVPLEEFGPIWGSARLKLGRSTWANSGLAPFMTSDVPYAGTSSGRLSEDAVQVFLCSAPETGDLRVLELGAGSGVFAKLFLDHLCDIAPDVYARTTYVVTDGSASVLAEQSAHGVLSAHTNHVEAQVLDVAGDWPGLAEFDAILGTYILDSLPFDLLAVQDNLTWRKEGRSVLAESDAGLADRLRASLDKGDADALGEWAWIGPRVGLQTRHVPVAREDLPHGYSLPRDTGGQTLPFVHCHGALACLRKCGAHLRTGGVAIFSDYGHLSYLPRYEFLEFQAFGNSIAVGVNFPQLSAADEDWPDVVLHRPKDEAGNLFTRVLRRGARDDEAMQNLVDTLYGEARHIALNDPIDKARAMLKSRYFESARAMYREVLAVQPGNWAIMEEIATGLLVMTEEHKAAIEMAEQGIERNPLGPGLWQVKAEASLKLGDLTAARAAVKRLIEIAPTLASAWRVMAQVDCDARDHPAALDAVATGLKHDHSGEEQEELLQVQSKILTEMGLQQHEKLLASANQFRALDGIPQ